MSDGSIKTPATSNNKLSPVLNRIIVQIRAKLNGSCLKQDKLTFNQKTVVNIYFVHEINLWPFKQSPGLTLGNSLFGAAKLTKNAGFDKYKYSGYDI